MTAIEKLAQTINSRCSGIQRANKDIVMEIGTINKDLSLKVTSIRNSIPKGDYMYLELSALLGKFDATISPAIDTVSNISITPGKEKVTIIPKLEAGDSVLVTWVGNEPIVIGKLYSS